MLYLKTNLERPPPRSLQYQYYLSSQDQHPVHKILRPVLLHKEHRPVPVSEDESTDNDDEHGEGESGPGIQSAPNHDSERTVLYPDLYVLTSDEHWTMTPRSTQVCSPQPGHFIS